MSEVHTDEYRAFLARLRAARKSAGMSQSQAALALGKHQSYVAKSESGERRIDVIEAKRFAALYGVSLDYLVG